MVNDIQTGSRINLKVVKQPTSTSASKTIVRLLSKDLSVVAENKRLRKVRDKNIEWRPRGGRLWGVRLKKQFPVKGNIGDSGTIVATYDVIKDLQSVSRFLEVSTA